MRIRQCVSAVVFLITPTVAVSGSAQQGVTYTAEQSARGADVYYEQCLLCHGTELDNGITSPLVGPAFQAKWQASGRGVADLFTFIRTEMPWGLGGSLTEQQYVDIVAYILERNGERAGSAALTTQAILASTAAAAAFIEGAHGMEPTSAGPTQADLNAAHQNARDWLYHTHDYTGRRYSGLSEITTANVSNLRPVCMRQIGDENTFQNGPIVYNGTMYVTTAQVTLALDAATCDVLWRHEWKGFWNNRGVGIKDGRLLRSTTDGYLIALDAKKGHLLWARQVADPSIGEMISMAPLIYDDLVIFGTAISENAINGWVGAFRLDNGEPVWKFNTVPGAEDGTGTWPNPENIKLGGGGVWTPFTLDVEREELYVAVTNPAPDLPAHLRPGLNLYTNSIVALDVRSGELRWYEQLVPNDAHDWDLTQVSPLFETTVGGKMRNLVSTVGKDGVLRVLDRDTHERLYETPVTTRVNVDVPLTKEGVRVCPGVTSGVLWNGPAYNPLTNTLYVGAVDWCTTFSLIDDDDVEFVPGQMFIGGEFVPDEEKQGWITAINASDGSVRWKYRSEMPVLAALTTTAGNVLFAGELTGDFVAFDADSGDELYRFDTGGPVAGGIVTYEADGKQYVAVVSGYPSILGWVDVKDRGSPTLVVFALPNR